MVRRFVNKEAYRKWNAYRYIHGDEEGHREKIIIAGHLHHVHHSMASPRRK